MIPFRPLLAAAVNDIDALPWDSGWVCSPKIDGIRAIVRDSQVIARSGKIIPNAFVRFELADATEGLDGELVLGNFQQTTSAIMSKDGKPDFRFWVFDLISDAPYVERLKRLDALPRHARVEVVPWTWVRSPGELRTYEETCLAEGFEGVCLRRPDSPYKNGRSTVREGYLLKLKRFQDAEAMVVGFEEQYRNDNALETNELGYAKRSHAKAGKVGKDTLGKILVEKDGVAFAIGTGFTDAQRGEIWANRAEYLGKIAKFKSQPYGVKDAPRLPVFLGWRAAEDT